MGYETESHAMQDDRCVQNRHFELRINRHSGRTVTHCTAGTTIWVYGAYQPAH